MNKKKREVGGDVVAVVAHSLPLVGFFPVDICFFFLTDLRKTYQQLQANASGGYQPQIIIYRQLYIDVLIELHEIGHQLLNDVFNDFMSIL